MISKNVFGQPRMTASLRAACSPRAARKSTVLEDLKKLIVMDDTEDGPRDDSVCFQFALDSKQPDGTIMWIVLLKTKVLCCLFLVTYSTKRGGALRKSFVVQSCYPIVPSTRTQPSLHANASHRQALFDSAVVRSRDSLPQNVNI